MMKLKLFGAAAAILSSALASPVMAQQVITDPGYCAQFYPNANCQNKGPSTAHLPIGIPNETEKGGGKPPFFMRGDQMKAIARYREGSGPLRASLIFDRPQDRRNPGISSAPKQSSIRRFSSAVEQRFCKPKVGSSILSTGTT